MASSKVWYSLQPGDIVEVVAPSSLSSQKDFQNAIKFVEELGLIPRAPKNIFGKDLLCANTDEMRFQHLKQALLAKDSKIVWSLRGGYGSLRILPQLHQLKKPPSKKLFIGYSDTTGLHNFFNTKWKWPSLHATMLEELGRGEAGRREIQDLTRTLYGLDDELVFKNLKPMNKSARMNKNIHSQVVGGNLAIIAATLGTPWSFKAKDKILVLEDIGERGYRVDRMLVHMEQAGVFEGVKAVIFGDFVGGEENKGEDCVYLWKDVQVRFAKESKFPVLKGIPFGHGAFQRPMPFQTPCVLQTGSSPTLSVRTY
jgi:muramoyltetrapeptide carboxypeptidase